jgi:hypothetical protein
MKPDWLVEGAEVAVIRYGNIARVTRTRVKKIVDKTFSLEGTTAWFRIADLRHNEPGSWGAASWVRPLDDPEVKALQAEQRRRSLENRADSFYKDWARTRTESGRQALIEALEALTPEEDK